MTKRLKIFEKLFFLIILVTFSHIQNLSANQTQELPPLPPLEAAAPEQSAVNKAETKKTTSSFIDRIKKFFTFKKEEPAPINNANKTKVSENENESFVDLGDNKLQEIKVEESDKTKLLQIPAEFQNLEESNEQTNAPLATAKLPDPSGTKDNKVQNLPAPSPPIASNQQNIDNKSNNNPAVTHAPPAVTNQGVADATEVREAWEEQQRFNNSANGTGNVQIPSIPSDDSAANLNNNKQAEQSAKLVSPEAPEVPSLPQINSSDLNQVTANAQQSRQPGIEKVEAPTPTAIQPAAPQNLAKDSNAQVLSSAKPSAEVKADVPSIPELPSSKTAESNIKNESVADKQAVEKIEIPTFDSGNASIAENSPSPSTATLEKAEIPSVPEVPSVPTVPNADDMPKAISENQGKVTIVGDVDNGDDGEDLSKFVIDEAKVLLLPNDDVVLGELSDTAEFEQIDFLKYSEIFKKQLDQANRSKQRSVIQNFLRDYDTNFNKVSILSDAESARDAFDAVDEDSLFRLRVLMDNNHLLQSRNEDGDTLLHVTAEKNNYYLTKFLILRGINLSSRNSNSETALMISSELENPSIIRLLKDAGAH